MPRKLLNVIDTLGLGGAERLLVTTHGHLDRAKFEPAVACLFGPNPLAAELRKLDVPVYELRLSGPRHLARGIARLRQLISRGRFDLVHTHLYYGTIAGRFAGWGRASVITTLHNTGYTHEDPGTLVFRGKKLLDRVSAKLINRCLLAVSEEVRRDSVRHLGLDSVVVIPNYTDVRSLQDELVRRDRAAIRKTWNVAVQDILLLNVGRLHAQKGQDNLVEAFAKARRDVPDLRLLVLGAGPEREWLEARVGELGESERVRFDTPCVDVMDYYRAADIFVFPSRYEPFGIALLEAMAAGLPSVVSDTAGIAELATRETAIFVTVEDTQALARAIVSLARDATLRQRLGAEARTRAEAFDVRRLVRRLEQVYASV